MRVTGTQGTRSVAGCPVESASYCGHGGVGYGPSATASRGVTHRTTEYRTPGARKIGVSGSPPVLATGARDRLDYGPYCGICCWLWVVWGCHAMLFSTL